MDALFAEVIYNISSHFLTDIKCDFPVEKVGIKRIASSHYLQIVSIFVYSPITNNWSNNSTELIKHRIDNVIKQKLRLVKNGTSAKWK